ncbi:MAG: hypothetical protein JSR91_04435 [Proteobacteria bacterium]|nr:hypothetical protein [Pseudomonadota bacterium]
MGKGPERTPPPLVRRVLRAVYEAARDMKPPGWVGIGTLGLRVDRIRLDQAIALAVRSGWLRTAGQPPLTIALTAAGTSLVEDSSDRAESA